MPLQRRVPKFGFKNPNRVEFRAINIDVLEQLATTHNVKEISPIELVQFGLASKNDLIKVLGRGELKSALTLRVHKVSQSAAAAITAAGGSVSLLQEVTK
jgi:large subunit ribosomal protein L15